ncbi:MAG: two component signal transduction system response regulator [Roseibaca calidilacus]|uniref:Response regulator receiver domain-containing protein n=1 Tax=Roseibaca calidilacus TaxID=1666912 RepID=A0A0P7WVW0_9RHOB|nr:MAG: two component signal transduction system response regulator [Roseibaca calidilacus]CUX82409.1 Response regulator receiver domain-containing protein [Roseibaca calidilacus]
MVQKRVLVIEDEPNISDAIRFILTRNGWQVEVEAGGTAALARLRADPPDALILDLMLPDMDGFEVLRHLRAAAHTRDLPVLMLTAKGQSADRDLAARLGVTCFMTKPFANSEVVAALQDIIGP